MQGHGKTWCGQLGLLLDHIMTFKIFILFAVLLAQAPSHLAYSSSGDVPKFRALDFVKNGANPDDLSGVAWSPETKSYFFVLNKKGLVYESDENFNHKRTITISNLGDSEEIVYLGMQENNGQMYPEVAISEESGRIFILTITEKDTYDTTKDGYHFTMNPNNENWGNEGIEGLAYDQVNKVFYAGKEKTPMAVYKFKRPDNSSIKSVQPTLLITNDQLSGHITDLSSLFFNEESQRLMILSHESYSMLDMAEDGTLVKKYPLSKYISKKIINSIKSQYEGITIGKDGDLILTSEPYYYQHIDLKYL